MKRELITLLVAFCAMGVSAVKTQTKVIFYSPHIVRIVKFPMAQSVQPEKQSFTVIMTPEKVGVKTVSDAERTEYSTESMRVVVDTKSGNALFLSLAVTRCLKK